MGDALIRDSELDVLPKRCVCGHDHTTARGEHVDLCLECRCDDYDRRCQNCGGSAFGGPRGSYDACSLRCKAQLDYADSLKEKAA